MATVAVNQTTETDSAQTVTAAKALTIGQSSSSESALSIGHSNTKAVNRAEETDYARQITPLLIYTYDQIAKAVSLSWKFEPSVTQTRYSSGNIRQRKLFANSRYVFDITLRLTDSEFATFESFVINNLKNGANYFNGTYAVSDLTETGKCRIIDGQYNAQYIKNDWWNVSYSFEVIDIDLSNHLNVYTLVNSASGFNAWGYPPATDGIQAPPFKYWRINISAMVNAGDVAEIGELFLFDEHFGPNLATTGTATASSNAGATALPAEANDGAYYYSDTSNAWIASSNSLPQWLQIEFPTAKAIVQYGFIAQTISPNPIKNFTLEYSSDGASWSVADTQTNITNYGLNDEKGRLFATTTPATGYSRLRFRFTNCDDITVGYRVANIQLFSSTGGTLNFAPFVIASASSTNSPQEPDLAFNTRTSLGEYWRGINSVSPVNLNASFFGNNRIDLASYKITAVQSSEFPEGTPTSWTVQGSNDGVDWTIIHTVIGESTWTGGETREYTL